jgi:peptide/nickel transport system permease protein
LGGFILRRLIQTVVVLLLVTILSFLLLHLIPGDPVLAMLGIEAKPAQIEQLRHELALDQPLFLQYTHWLGGVLHGDMGRSIYFSETVSQLMKERLPITAYLAAIALVLSIILGIWAGVICAIRRGGVIDSLITVLANIGIAVPTFWLGILGIWVLSLKLNWLPVAGFTWPTENLSKSILQSILPLVCLSVPGIAVLARQTRSSMLEVIHQDYIRTAIAKGLRERAVVMHHALKNALIPIITLTGMQVRLLVGGAVLTETVFSIPGMGRLLVRAAFDKDYMIVQSGVFIVGVAVCLTNLLVDISYGWVDPRIRFK